MTYTFDFVVPSGSHMATLHIAESFVSTAANDGSMFDATGERWVVADIGTARCDPCSPASVSWTFRDTAP